MSLRLPLFIAALVLSLPSSPGAAADKLEKEDKRFLEEVAPLILPPEDKTFRELSKGDRPEFQRIFWARRDPNLETPENEYQIEYQKLRAEADSKFRAGGRPGSATDCGRVFILLGPPEDVKKTGGEETLSRRGAETWTYRDRPGMTFKDGEVQIAFDESCQLPQGARLGEQLNRVAEGKIAQPNIDYRKGSDGRLVKLADLLPKPTPVQALLKQPRQEFEVAAETKMLLRSPGGASYVAGLVRGEGGALSPQEVGGKKVAKIVVAAQAVDESGKAVSTPEHEMPVELAADGSFVASYGLALHPGKYTLRVGALDAASKKGAVASLPLEMPGYGTDEMTLSQVLVLKDIQEGQAPNPQDPYWAFSLGNTRFVPTFGNVFTPVDSITLVCALYDPKVDETTGKPSTTYSFTILKDGKPVARAEEQTSDSPNPTPSVGPVPLAKYTPGKYTAQIKVRDNVAKKDLTGETVFEVKP